MGALCTDLALTETQDGVTIPIRALPRARHMALAGVIGGALRVQLAAPPIEGAANKALLQYLTGVLGVPKRDLDLVSGEHGRHKLVRVRGLSGDGVRQRLVAASQ